MPRKKKSKKETSYWYQVSKLNLAESYVSLFLGVLVVVIIAILLFLFFSSRKSRGINLPNLKSQLQQQQKNQVLSNKNEKNYTVKDGESLWDVAVNSYGDGYRWADIAKANNLDDPDSLSAGMKLIVP